MKIDPAQLQQAATELGFQAEPLEKAIRLLDLLASLRSHPYLARRLVLKGGTALNLFILDVPRLSVDVDLNYVGSLDRATMLGERPKVEQAVRAVCARQNLNVLRVPEDHAGGKWRLSYERADGGTGTLELDLNFMLRVPLWPATPVDSPKLLGFRAERIPVLDLHELAGGKLAALFTRSASRDLYDAVQILEQPSLVRESTRLAFLLYGAMSRRDWRTVSPDEVDMTPRDATARLLPMLRAELAPQRDEVEPWCAAMVERCRKQLAAVLPLEPRELEFLDRINEEGEIRPGLLTADPDMQERIRRHPGLKWKALNVRRYRGKLDGEEAENPAVLPEDP